MPWSSLANNQMVTFNNLQDAVNTGVFTAKTSIPASNECITKTDANTYVNINTSNGGYASKASNQLVAKQDLSASVPSEPVYIYGQANYPVTGGNSTITGYIWNNSSSAVYVKLFFNSGGVSSGSIAANKDVLAVYLSSIVSISVTGTITGFGTNLISSSYITIAPYSAPYFYIDKLDGFGSGSTLRIYYSYDLVNYSPIPVVFP